MYRGKYNNMTVEYKRYCRKYYERQEKLYDKQLKMEERNRLRIYNKPSIVERSFDVFKIIGLIIVILALLIQVIQEFNG